MTTSAFSSAPRSCSFCGLTPDLADADFLYPHGRSRAVWGAHCSECRGGCEAEILGSSKEEALANWNKRASPSPAQALLPAIYHKDILRAILALRHSAKPERSHEADTLEAMLLPPVASPAADTAA